MQPVSDQIYFREFDPRGRDSLTKLARRIERGATVLDVGCGPGVLGGRLAATMGCVVDGIEGNPDAAALAAEKLRRVVVADLEAGPVAALVGEQRYDYIVCADVLEHLRRPEALLAQLPALLTPSGRILLSIPNVAYAGLVGALVNGEFRYRSEGLLDATHLRFFTRRSLEELVERCGLAVVHADAVTMPINESEFAGDGVDRLPPAMLRALLARPDALTYQFILELVPAGRAGARTDVPANEPAFSFVAQLHYRSDGPFDAAHACTVHGAMGVERQTLRFALPPAASGWSALRFDPANRPGYLRLHAMALVDDGGRPVWRWQPQAQPLDRGRSHELYVVADDAGALLVLGGDDPWLELPIDEPTLRALRGGGTLEVELAWPQSADSFAVIRRLFDGAPDAQRTSEIVRLGAEVRALRDELAAAHDQLRVERAALATLQRSLTFRVVRPLRAVLSRLRRGR